MNLSWFTVLGVKYYYLTQSVNMEIQILNDNKNKSSTKKTKCFSIIVMTLPHTYFWNVVPRVKSLVEN